MNDPAFAVLASAAGTSMSLRRVTATGRASGLLLSMSVRQHYRNETPEEIETVYTFPLAWGAVPTGLSVEIGGRRLEGTVLPRAQARARYEEAIGDGDSPILVEKSSDALYTAQLGSLKPGEDATIELRYAQLLRVEQGRVRLSVPTTIAPRYGDPVRDAGVGEHESVGASLSAAYPFEFELRVDGALAAGAIASPTHAVAVMRGDAGATIRLARSGWLDRDLVLTFDGAAAGGGAHAVRAADGDGCVVLASFCPSPGASARASVDVKLLVDCSGSMNGDGIESARRGLHRALAELRLGDRFAYSRFGSRVVHAFDGLREADAASVAAASALVDGTRADLGGTEMHAALASTFALGGAEAADVLLVTDGEVWAIDAIVEAARASGHRVFAVGVGSAPAESLLRRLAEATGGACELVSPNESVEDAIVRVFARLRVARARDVSVAWGVEPAWATRAPLSVFDGDTVHVVAGFASAGAAIVPTLRYALDGDGEPRTLVAAVESLATAEPGEPLEPLATTLPRLAAHLRIVEATVRDGERAALEDWARELAVRHGLVTAATGLFLVHRRADADKASGMPALRKIDSMLAAGWGGTGSARRPDRASLAMRAVDAFDVGEPPTDAYRALDTPAMDRVSASARRLPPAPEGPASIRFRADFDAPGGWLPPFLRALAPSARSTPRRLLSTVRSALRAPGDLDALLRRLGRAAPPPGIAEVLREIEAGGASRDEAWLIVLAWLARHVGDAALPGDAAVRVLDARLASVPAERRDAGTRLAARRLAAATLEAW